MDYHSLSALTTHDLAQIMCTEADGPPPITEDSNMSKTETTLGNLVVEEKEDFHLLLTDWQELSKKIATLKQTESAMRTKLMTNFFPDAEEGTNTFDLGNLWKLKGVRKITRKCDEASFEAVFEELPEGMKDSLIKFKPELVGKEYKKLSVEHKKIFDQCLIIKDGMPSLKVVPPKGA